MMVLLLNLVFKIDIINVIYFIILLIRECDVFIRLNCCGCGWLVWIYYVGFNDIWYGEFFRKCVWWYYFEIVRLSGICVCKLFFRKLCGDFIGW